MVCDRQWVLMMSGPPKQTNNISCLALILITIESKMHSNWSCSFYAPITLIWVQTDLMEIVNLSSEIFPQTQQRILVISSVEKILLTYSHLNGFITLNKFHYDTFHSLISWKSVLEYTTFTDVSENKLSYASVQMPDEIGAWACCRNEQMLIASTSNVIL